MSRLQARKKLKICTGKQLDKRNPTSVDCNRVKPDRLEVRYG